MTLQEAKQQLALKLDINYSDIANNGLFTDSDLGTLIQNGVTEAWDYKPWPFTQDAKTATTPNGADYWDSPQDFVEGSIYLLKIGGKEYAKRRLEDYLKVFENAPTATDRIWTEFKTFILANKNAFTSGTDTFDAYGKLKAPTLVNPTDLLPFSPTTDNQEYSGNNAIVQLAFAEALSGEKKNQPEKSVSERAAAFSKLDTLWKPFADNKATLQSLNRPMFDVPDMFGKTFKNGNQFTPGNF